MIQEFKQFPQKRKKRFIYRGFILRVVFLFFLIIFSVSGFYAYKIYKLEKNIIQMTNEGDLPSSKSTIFSAAKQMVTSDYKSLRGSEKNRINILLLGMGGEGHSGKYLTDTIMIASINPQTLETALLSIPRDLYVNIPGTNIHTKINAVYTYELNRNNKDSAKAMKSVEKVIEKITGQSIDYYFSLNFEGFTKIIDEIGGVTVDVPEDIFDPRYPGPNFSYQTFEIKKGVQYLDGEAALKYARVRHTTGGDFARASRQQAIIAATKRKAFSINTITNPSRVNGLMNALGENLKTDVQFDEIPAFLELSKNINIYQTVNKVLDAWSKDSLLAVSHVNLGGVRAFVLIPRINSYKEIQALAKNIFSADYLEKQKQEIEKENAKILALTSQDVSSGKIRSILQDLGYQSPEIKNDKTIFEKNCNNKTEIINNQFEKQEAKLFTINDLAGKFDAEVRDASIEDIEQEVIICLNSKTIEYFESQILNSSEIKTELEEQSVIDKDGNLLFNEER